jgi:hypothetical protein
VHNRLSRVLTMHGDNNVPWGAMEGPWQPSRWKDRPCAGRDVVDRVGVRDPIGRGIASLVDAMPGEAPSTHRLGCRVRRSVYTLVGLCSVFPDAPRIHRYRVSAIGDHCQMTRRRQSDGYAVHGVVV